MPEAPFEWGGPHPVVGAGVTPFGGGRALLCERRASVVYSEPSSVIRPPPGIYKRPRGFTGDGEELVPRVDLGNGDDLPWEDAAPISWGNEHSLYGDVFPIASLFTFRSYSPRFVFSEAISRLVIFDLNISVREPLRGWIGWGYAHWRPWEPAESARALLEEHESFWAKNRIP